MKTDLLPSIFRDSLSMTGAFSGEDCSFSFFPQTENSIFQGYGETKVITFQGEGGAVFLWVQSYVMSKGGNSRHRNLGHDEDVLLYGLIYLVAFAETFYLRQEHIFPNLELIP